MLPPRKAEASEITRERVNGRLRLAIRNPVAARDGQQPVLHRGVLVLETLNRAAGLRGRHAGGPAALWPGWYREWTGPHS